MGIGNCYEQTGDLNRAAGAYVSAYNHYPNWILADNAIKGAGRCYRLLNKNKEAADIYNRYINEHSKEHRDILDEIRVQLAYLKTLNSAH